MKFILQRPFATQFVCTALLAILLAPFAPRSIDRSNFRRAVSQYAQNPNPATSAALEQEWAINDRINLRIDIFEALLLFCLMNGVWFFASRLKHALTRQNDPASPPSTP